MFLWISGFLSGDADDNTLKFDLNVKPQHEAAVLKVLGWKSLEESPDGEWLLTSEQVERIATAVDEPLPTDLDMFIGVTAGSA